MHTLDHAVLRQSLQWSLEPPAAWLCTIVAAVGSSPRPVGSMLACNAAGQSAGSLSGGCVEEDLLARLRNGDLDTRSPRVIEYGVSAGENERLGLPCGGHLHILVQALTETDSSWLEAAVAAVENRYCLLRTLSLKNGKTSVAPVDLHIELSFTGERLQQCFGPQMRMLLIGAGQLARSVAELALAMDYQVVVSDPRQEMLDQWNGPDVSLVQGMPDDVVREHVTDSSALVITLTHDPRIDDMALMEALNTRAWYVGALGSRKSTARRLDRLRALDIEEQALERLHAPVGLPIGSKTPMEIAVSILAEITRLRRDSNR